MSGLINGTTLNAILKDGRVIRGWLGISLVPPNQEDVLKPREMGVVIADVLQNGPAAGAGLKIGDKIMQVNGETISSSSHLINYVALQAPKSTIKISIIRNNEPMVIDVVVGERKVQQSDDSQFIPLPQR